MYSSNCYSLYSSCSSSQVELLYHEPGHPSDSSSRGSVFDSQHCTGDSHYQSGGNGVLQHIPPPPPPPPPPLPKRNSILVPAPGRSLHYGPDGQLRAGSRSPSPGPGWRKGSLPAHLTGLPRQLVTHEIPKHAHYSEEEESWILESRQYVREIKQRREDIHRTLLRGKNPGNKMRTILGYRLERRLVRALSNRKLRQSRPSLAPKKKPARMRRFFRRATRRPRHLAARLVQRWRMAAARADRARLVDEDEDEQDYHENDYGDMNSRRSTPRLIVDHSGTLRWPPVKMGYSESPNTQVLDSDNFLLKIPSSKPSSSPPSVLGWLQVKSNSHVFTPAVEKVKGPFRKVPFHPHLHVLNTRVK